MHGFGFVFKWLSLCANTCHVHKKSWNVALLCVKMRSHGPICPTTWQLGVLVPLTIREFDLFVVKHVC
jgi:hypothetical protein